MDDDESENAGKIISLLISLLPQIFQGMMQSWPLGTNRFLTYHIGATSKLDTLLSTLRNQDGINGHASILIRAIHIEKSEKSDDHTAMPS